jgi:hypothetical protein
VLRAGAWRQFVTEALTLAAATGALAIGVLAWAGRPAQREVVLLALISTAWCLYVAQGAARRWHSRRRLLASGFPTLHLDDLGARVRHPFGNRDGAFLAWADCAAVVVSRPPTAGRTQESYRAYVEFVPVSPDRIEGVPRASDQRRVLLERPAEEVRLVWMELSGVGRTAVEVAAWLRSRRPTLTVVDSLDRHSASTL